MKNEIAKSVSCARASKNLSQSELAILAKTNITTISLVENGKIVPRLSTLKRICDSLGLNFDEMSKIAFDLEQERN